MPNHVHLLVHLPENITVTRFLASIKQPVSFRALKWIEEHKPEILKDLIVKHGKKEIRRFWQQGGGYDRNIFSDEALFKTVEYIHNNPVRLGLVEYPENWNWSSAGFWIKEDIRGIKIDVPPMWT